MTDASVRNRKGGAARPRPSTARPVISSTSDSWSTRRIVSIAAATTLGALSAFWLAGSPGPSNLKQRWFPTSENEWDNRRDQVKDAFVSSWDAYSKYAWGESKYYVKTV
jgi:hypothetical protein